MMDSSIDQTRGVQIAPSILDSDLANIADTVALLEGAGINVIHLDVMDGVFVPNISFGMPVVAAIRRRTEAFLDVHLMIAQPERYVDGFADAGANCITVHPEATAHVHRALQRIRERGVMAGLALNPGTPVSHAIELLDAVDLVLIMSVNPGYGGQQFIASALDRLRRVREAIESRESSVVLEVDGGIKPAIAPDVVRAGARWLVAGSAVVGHAEGPAAGVAEFQDALGLSRA